MEVSEEERHQLIQNGETSTEVRPTQESAPRRKSTWLLILAAIIAIIAIVAIIMMRSGTGGRSEGGGSTRLTSNDHSPGSEVELYIPGRDTAMAAVDERTLDELIVALSTRSNDAQALIQSGKVITVPNNTRVRIIETGFAKLKVRIIEGDKLMHEVWVPERWVK